MTIQAHTAPLEVFDRRGLQVHKVVGDALTVRIYKREGGTEAWGGNVYYFGPTYSACAFDGEGNAVWVFRGKEPGRKYRSFLKEAKALAEQLAANGIG